MCIYIYAYTALYLVEHSLQNEFPIAYILIRLFYRKDFEDVISRKPSASPATGFAKVHAKEQANIVTRSFE